MIRITDTPKPRDRFGSIPIRDGKTNRSLLGPHLPRRSRRSSIWNRLKKIMSLLVGLTLLLVLASPLLIPYLAATLLPKHLASALNRPVTIARGEFNPFTCTLTLHRLIIGPKLSLPDDPVDPLLSAGRMAIHLEPKRLLSGELVCDLDAEHFFLHLVRRKDGGYNLGQALDELRLGMPALPLLISWNTITANDSRLVFDDEQNGKTHLAEEIALTISFDQANPLDLQAKINGTPIALAKAANLAVSPSPPPNPRPDKPGPAEPEETGTNPDTPDDPATKTAEAIALIQNLTQAVRQYRQNPVNPPVERRMPPLAP